jgi:outer membrane protein OmpA-like peptidoglycan-associated protein
VAGASAEGEINHWPGFVDALTTIIMVVTFLLIILGATVFILSKKVVEQVRAEHASEKKKNGENSDVKKLLEQLDKARAEIVALKRSVSPLKSPHDAEDGSSIANTDDFLRQDEEVQGDTRLSIRTRATDNTKKIRVASVEAPSAKTGNDVRTAELLLDIDFAPKALDYTPEAATEIKNFLDNRSELLKSARFEIWSFAPSVASVSEAQRIAYYRALKMRNILIERGVSANRIGAQIRVDDQVNRGHTIKVVLKP